MSNNFPPASILPKLTDDMSENMTHDPHVGIDKQITETLSLSRYLMSDRELNELIRLIHDSCGISLNSTKKSMLSARLGKRLRALGLPNFKEYYKYVQETLGQNDELVLLIDAVTTNTTHFFRENNHFDYLAHHALHKLHGDNDNIKVWSAGCSTGEEPYTIAMVLSDYFRHHPGDYRILATDICTSVLEKARQGIYESKELENIPPQYKYKYLMRGKGAQAGRWRIVPEIRKKVDFGRFNLVSDDYDIGGPFDVIFCRNVIIYFDAETNARLIDRFYRHLVPGGYLFIGHSETLTGKNEHFKSVAPTVYRKPEKYDSAVRRLAG